MSETTSIEGLAFLSYFTGVTEGCTAGWLGSTKILLTFLIQLVTPKTEKSTSP